MNDEKQSIKDSEKDIFVVALGASAGGLEALEVFFDNCPPNTGLTYIIVQHLSPDHKSLMKELLTRHTKMEVVIADDGLRIKRNTVYLIPPAKIIEVENGRIHVTSKPKHQLSLPIDILLYSLAKSCGSNAIAMILSGTGSDGTRGALAIHDESGLVLVQDPEEAKFDGMPRSVINTGIVDLTLSVTQMPQKAIDYSNHKLGFTHGLKKSVDDDPHDVHQAYQEIIQLLFDEFAVDFTTYKQHTLERRIQHRMQVLQYHKISEYLELLRKEREEPFMLYKEILIPVTRFFRDEEAFDEFNEKAVEQLVIDTPVGRTIRVWVAACSTGEEAYSIAMLFIEAFKKHNRPIDLKIFATDVNQASIEYAGNGYYPESIEVEVPPEYLAHYFDPTENGYRVRSDLRQYLVFARHNLIDSPPFTHMDLVSCRNMLIYLNQKTQNRVLNRLIYSVTKGGFLFLGSSESISIGQDYLTTISNKSKLFLRVAEGHGREFFSDMSNSVASNLLMGRRFARKEKRAETGDQSFQHLLDKYVPPAILVSQQGDIMRIFGSISHLIEINEGIISQAMSDMLPMQVATVAASLIHKSQKEGTSIQSDSIQLKLEHNDKDVHLRLNCIPLLDVPHESQYLVVFEPVRHLSDPVQESHSMDDLSVERIKILEQELDATRDYLQATVEDLETTNEELQATNEELMASNEELQSSNEELQSVNEELNTVNIEYQQKVNELNTSNAELDSMSSSVGVATLFVDEDIKILRFTPDCKQLFNIRDNDVGRLLSDFSHSLEYPELIQDMKQTIESQRVFESEVVTQDKVIYLMRMMPYRVALSGKVGAVISFTNISSVKNARALQAVIDGLEEHVAVLKPTGMIARVNRSWKYFAQCNGDPTLSTTCMGVNYLETLKNGDLSEDTARQAYDGLKSVIERRQPFFNLKYPCHSPDEERWFLMSASPVEHEEYSVVVSHFNITEWYHGEE